MKATETTSVEQTVAASQAANAVAQAKFSANDLYYKIFGDYEFRRYGIYAVLLVWNTCLGGIAVSMGALESPVQLALLVFPTMGLLAWVLAVQPMKIILHIATAATIIDLAVILYNVL